MPVGRKEAEPAARPAGPVGQTVPTIIFHGDRNTTVHLEKPSSCLMRFIRGILAIVDRESGIEADLVGMFTQQSSRCRERYPPSLVRRS